MKRYVLSIIALTIIYALALVSFHPWDLAIGALLASIVMILFHDVVFNRGPGEEGASHLPVWRRCIWFIPYAFMVAVSIGRGTWRMLLIVFGVRPLVHPGIIAIPLGERTPSGVAVTAIADTLSPGSVLIDVDWDRRIAWVHVIDASDPDEVRRGVQELYERYQRNVFP